jgi:histidine ammonia-lyase
MLAQVTAAARVGDEPAHPAGVDTIDLGKQEDHVSMSMTAALRPRPA